MYEQAFNLTSRPFTSMHYVKHYFPAKAIHETLQTCKMMVERGAGPVVVVGDHGTGKTLLLAKLEEMFKTQLRVINISATVVRGREDMLQNILYQLQLNYRGLGENEMRLDLIDYLRKDESTGILLLIDNAQKLNPEAIEEVQLLLPPKKDKQHSDHTRVAWHPHAFTTSDALGEGYHYLIAQCFGQVVVDDADGDNMDPPVVQATDDAKNARWIKLDELPALTNSGGGTMQLTPGVERVLARAHALWQAGLLPTTIYKTPSESVMLHKD